MDMHRVEATYLLDGIQNSSCALRLLCESAQYIEAHDISRTFPYAIERSLQQGQASIQVKNKAGASSVCAALHA
jgi:hypothetical protein